MGPAYAQIVSVDDSRGTVGCFSTYGLAIALVGVLPPDVRPNFILVPHGFEKISAAAKAGATVYDVAYVNG